jgi:hypothetical protein
MVVQLDGGIQRRQYASAPILQIPGGLVTWVVAGIVPLADDDTRRLMARGNAVTRCALVGSRVMTSA